MKLIQAKLQEGMGAQSELLLKFDNDQYVAIKIPMGEGPIEVIDNMLCGCKLLHAAHENLSKNK